MKQSHTNARVHCSMFQVCLVGINEFGGAEYILKWLEIRQMYHCKKGLLIGILDGFCFFKNPVKLLLNHLRHFQGVKNSTSYADRL